MLQCWWSAFLLLLNKPLSFLNDAGDKVCAAAEAQSLWIVGSALPSIMPILAWGLRRHLISNFQIAPSPIYQHVLAFLGKAVGGSVCVWGGRNAMGIHQSHCLSCPASNLWRQPMVAGQSMPACGMLPPGLGKKTHEDGCEEKPSGVAALLKRNSGCIADACQCFYPMVTVETQTPGFAARGNWQLYPSASKSSSWNQFSLLLLLFLLPSSSLAPVPWTGKYATGVVLPNIENS